MSSLRPIATIALLAAVGLWLYMMINKTEPKLSPELQEWSTSTLEVGGPDDFAASPAASAPTDPAALPAPNAGGAAPPFASAQLNPPAATTSGAAAPPWTPGPKTAPAASASTSTTSSDSSPVARTAEAMPELPDMPARAGGDEADASVDLAAEAPAFNPTAPAEAPTTAAAPDVTPTPSAPASETSMFAAARVAVEGALDRGELAQALSMLSEWYGDPSLTPAESKQVNDLLAQLAGSVIYEGPPAHRLLPPHLVKDGETLETIAAKYSVPPQLLAKINGVAESGPLAPGQELKVVQGPFSAIIDLSERKMTLKLERRYAGQFPLEMDPTATIEEGEWKVDQKYLTPGAGGIYAPPGAPTEDRSLLLANIANPTGQAALLRGPGAAGPMASQPVSRVLRLKAGDVGDVYDILSVGSRVTIQR